MPIQPEQILQQYWGFTSFRGEQKNIINDVLAKKDVMALLPTGGGKSICFQIPALMQEGVCLVISPLIALMKDQVENLNKRNIAATAIYSGMSFFEVKKTLQQVANDEFKFLYISPERLETSLFLEYLSHINVCLIAIDEAHCISQWGYDFRPPYLKIATLRDDLPNTPFIALTASATPLVQTDIVAKLKLNNASIFQQSFAKPNLSYSVFNVDSKVNKAIDVLNKVTGSSIVYCNSRKLTKQIAMQLQQQGLQADFYHAGLTQQERSKKQENWINNKCRIIVCTNAFGMGIDKPDVRTVIHFNVPDCLENYYQEAGRAGRDGKRAFAILLYEKDDLLQLEKLVEEKFPSIEVIKKVYQHIANYLQIPVGIGEGNYYDFNLLEFCNNFKVEYTLAINVLRLLEQQGHISFNENIFLPSQVRFLADKNILNNIEQSHPQLDIVMKCLLRMYEGIYENQVSINEKLIAKNAKLSYEKVYANLKSLQAYGVIEYLPQKETPQLYFLLNRASAQHLHLDLKLFEERKKLYKERIAVIMNYVQLNKNCRSKFISNYFGDNNIDDCECCDNCLAKNSKAISQQEFERIKATVLSQLHKGDINIEQLFLQLKNEKKKNLWTVINFLITEQRLTIDGNKNITLSS